MLETASHVVPVREGGWAASSQACLPGTMYRAPTRTTETLEISRGKTFGAKWCGTRPESAGFASSAELSLLDRQLNRRPCLIIFTFSARELR